MTPKNMVASVHDRLLNIAHATQRPFAELLQYYGIERFLYRLSQSPYQSQFILKGALVFVAWGVASSRPTKDVELLGYGQNKVETIEGMMQVICSQPVVDDGLIFQANSVRGERIKEGADYEGVRIKLLAKLGKARIVMQIDIGFGDVLTPPPQRMDYPTLLDLPLPQLRGYSRETVIAEKYHAVVVLGQINSRMKDFYDLWILATLFEFEGTLLQTAIMETFSRRETAIPTTLPIGLTDTFAEEKKQQWHAFLKRTRLIKDEPIALLDVICLLRDFLQVAEMKPKVWREKRWQIESSS